MPIVPFIRRGGNGHREPWVQFRMLAEDLPDAIVVHEEIGRAAAHLTGRTIQALRFFAHRFGGGSAIAYIEEGYEADFEQISVHLDQGRQWAINALEVSLRAATLPPPGMQSVTITLPPMFNTWESHALAHLNVCKGVTVAEPEAPKPVNTLWQRLMDDTDD
jgi:hypothetical protein